jgi:hypothetical protein
MWDEFSQVLKAEGTGKVLCSHQQETIWSTNMKIYKSSFIQTDARCNLSH